MALSSVTYTGDGTQREFSVTFSYIDKSHVTVLVNGVAVPFVWLNYALIQTATAPAPGTEVKVARTTPSAERMVDFNDGSILTEGDLDVAHLQVFNIVQEALDTIDGTYAAIEETRQEAEDAVTLAAASASTASTKATEATTAATNSATSASAAAASAAEAAATLANKQNLVLRVPTDYGAVGDGTTDATAAVDAAATAAGTDGEVYVPKGTFRISSRLNRPQARFRGPGLFTDGTLTWPADRDARPRKNFAQRLADSVTVTAVGYAHLPNVCRPIDGSVLVQAMVGRNHGQSDPEGISTRKAVGTTNFTIDGNEASGGQVVMGGVGSRVQIVSDADESGKTFTVTGIVNGSPDTEVISGAVGGTSTGAKRFTTVTSVVASSGTAGRVSIGLFTVPSDLRVYRSENGGATFTETILGNGMTGWTGRYYENVNWVSASGRVIAMAQYWDMVNAVTYRRWVSEDNGFSWSPFTTPTFNFSWVSTLYLYGNPKVGSDGTVYIAAYDGGTTPNVFIIFSKDDGVTWNKTADIASPGGGVTYTEPAFSLLDDKSLRVTLRVNGTTSAFKEYRSFNGGTSWGYMGETNLKVTGAYASPEHQLFVSGADGVSYLALAYAARPSSGTAPDNPGSISIVTSRVTDAASFSNLWSTPKEVANFLPVAWAAGVSVTRDSYVLASNGGSYRARSAHTTAAATEPGVGASWETVWESLPVRGGYPSFIVDEDTGIGLLVYAHETGFRTSEIRLKRVALAEFTSRYSNAVKSWTPKLVGNTVAGPNAYTARSGKVYRWGQMVYIHGSMTINGALVSTGTTLTIEPEVAGSLPKPSSGDAMGKLQASAITGAAGTITGRYIKAVAGQEKFQLLHETATAFSFLVDTELGSGEILTFECFYLTDDP
jgi:hypothetical protein